MIIVLSLGAGVQSSTVVKMTKHGFIKPMPDAGIFADVQAEPQSVYKWLDLLESQGIPYPIYHVTRGNLADDGLKVARSKLSGKLYQKNLIPLFIKKPNGKKGILQRKCTSEYKVREIIKKTRSLLKPGELLAWRKKYKAELTVWREFKKEVKLAKKEKRACGLLYPSVEWKRMQDDALVESWIGISTDEASRMKQSREPWIRNKYPLIEHNISREQCVEWMLAEGYPEPPRSACIFCPYHSDEEWKRLRDKEPEEFQRAVEWEREAQKSNVTDEVTIGIPFLHASLVPLDQVVFSEKKQIAQQSLFDNECEGMCGV